MRIHHDMSSCLKNPTGEHKAKDKLSKRVKCLKDKCIGVAANDQLTLSKVR